MEIIDTTLREGLQSPLWDDYGKYYPSTEEKVEIFTALVRYGVRYFEVFSPAISSREKEDLGEIIARKERLTKETKCPIFIFVHSRCHPKDIEEALQFKIDGLNFYIGTSAVSQKFNHSKRLKEIIAAVKPMLSGLRKNYPGLQLRFSGEDAFRTADQELFLIYDKLSDVVDRFGLPDTVGTATPEEVGKRIALFKNRYSQIFLEGHFHNDRGLALANSLAAIEANIDFVQTSILGFGERSGITSLTALLFNLFLQGEKLTGFDLSASYSLNVLLAGVMKMQVPAAEPISLTNRTHSAGVHTQAVLKNSAVYEGHPWEKFGVTEQRLLLGQLSGRHIIHYFLTEILNFVGVTKEMVEELTPEFKKRAAKLPKGETPRQLLEKIAMEYGLAKKEKPATHFEKLNGDGSVDKREVDR